MMPLTFAKAGEVNFIKKIGGKDETKRFLNNLGFIEGGEITIVSENAGNLIVNVKNTRVAIGKEMANRIVV
jgi:ferrous iron transport protein A